MEQRIITDIIKNDRHRKELGNIEELAADIGEIGLLHPIVITSDNILIAGERRLEACKLLGWKKIPVRIIDVESIARGEYSENVNRKDFSSSEAYSIWQAIKPKEEQAAKERQEATQFGGNGGGKFPPPKKGKSRDRAAKATGKSGKTMEKIEYVMNEAESLAMPELIELMDSKSVDAAVKKAKEKKREKELSEMVVRADSIPPSDRWSVFQADIKTASVDEPLDAIITDPPYPKEYLPLWLDLAKFAKQNLKIGGVLLAMTPAPYLPQILGMLGMHLDYQWVLACVLPGSHGSVIKSGVRNVLWKPILVYRNGGEPVNIGSDLFENDNRDKEFHEWGQGVGGYIWQIEKFTKPGDLVCDPFLGGGTTAVSAIKLNRRFIGFDVDEEKVKISKTRISEFEVK